MSSSSESHARSAPTVNLEDITSDDPARRASASRAIREGFGHFGLLYISHHGIERGALDAFFDNFVALTARPDEEKRVMARPDLWFQRGWTPPNTERAVVAGGQPDFKECYFAAPVPGDAESALNYPQLYPENIWPERDPEPFRSDYLTMGRKLHAVGQTLLRGCAMALDLPSETFTDATRSGPHVTRALRYLPLTDEQTRAKVLWGEEHTDYNLVTLLPGGRFLDPQGNACARPDDHSGLYLRTRATGAHPRGELVPGTPPAGCIVAQVGQELEILTGGTFLATPHVITAPSVPGYSRISAAHFVHLHTEQVLRPLGMFRTLQAMREYGPPVLAGTYAIKTLVDIGLAPPDAINKLGYRHYDRLASIRASEVAR